MTKTLAIDETLVKEVEKLGRHRTQREAVEDALRDYLRIRRQQRVLKEFGTIEFRRGYDYKTLRERQ